MFGTRTFVGLTTLFFCSGALALIYEVVWQRQFALVFGSAAPATAAVLAAYFAGLGAGSLALGAVVRKWSRPLRVYAILEALIGVGALLVTPILSAFEKIHPSLVERYAASPSTFVFVKLALALLAIALPALCMGGTLPVLGQLVDRGQRRLGMSAGLLYVANTAGAGLGALSVPFLLLPALGVKGTVWLCVSGNILVGLAAWWMDRRWAIHGAQSRTETRPVRLAPRKIRLDWPILTLSLISGLAAFILQVLWNRAFAQVHENSVYSFTLIVAVFIFALAAGAQVARIGLRRGIAAKQLLGWAWLVGGVLVAATPSLFLRLTDGLAYLPSDGGWSQYAQRLAGVTVVVVFVPVMFLGIGFPVILEQAGRRNDASAGHVIGQMLAANLTGSVAGALIAGFLLPRWFGLWSGILLVAAGLIAAGMWQFDRCKTASARLGFRSALVLAFACNVWPIANVKWPRVRIAESQGERLIAVSEGIHGITAVLERSRSRRLKLNNHYVLGGTASAGDERLQAHVPLLLHPAPRRVAVLGLGTGITASGAMFHPVSELTVVELVPEVVGAARDYFREANAGVLENPKTRIVVEDARNYLRGTRAKFDVIVGDLVVPWRHGESALFTQEHFAAARQALAPGGLFCQWLPMFQLSEPELQIVLRTFLTIFPRAFVWRGDFSPNEPAVALVGALEPFVIKPAEVERRLRELRTDPTNPQLAEPIAFWMHWIGVVEIADLLATETRVHREDSPWIELLGPMQRDADALFIGRRLQSWMNELKLRSTGRIVNESEAWAVGSRAGDLLAEFTLLLSERNGPQAQAIQAKLRSVLLERVFKIIFPEESPARAR